MSKLSHFSRTSDQIREVLTYGIHKYTSKKTYICVDIDSLLYV